MTESPRSTAESDSERTDSPAEETPDRNPDHATDGGTARAEKPGDPDETPGQEMRDPTEDGPGPSRTPPDTGAAAVIAALERAGVDDAFGVQGGAIMPVYDELYDSSVDHMTMAHEQGAAHAADAYGVVTGNPGVCLATSGPGATNLVTGIADASMDSDSLLALTGQVPTDFVGNDAFQETDTVGVTSPITKHNYFASDSDTVGDMVSEAFALSETGRPGPTLVDLPKDVSFGEAGTQPAPPTPPAGSAPTPTADPEAVERAAEVLENADRPLCLYGGGVIKAEASDVARDFARDHGVPVVTTMPGIGSFPDTDPLCLEWAGMHGTGYANMGISHTDCMIAVGTRFDDRLTGGVESFAPEAEIVHIDIDPAEISKNVYADHPLIGDAGAVLEQLSEAITESPDTDDWQQQCLDWQDTYPMAYQTPDDEPVKPQFVVEAYDEATDDDTIVTTGVGQHQMWASQYWTFTQPRTWVSSHGLGTMGYGLPAAIGARQAADPNQDVVCFDGDGSFLMTIGELSVAVREHLDITIVVLNNEAIGMVRQWQDAFFEERHMASEYPWIPEFDTLAEAFGAKGFRVTEYDEMADVVEESMAYDGPSIVDAHIDPAENVFPMVASGGDNAQFALQEDQL